MSLCSELAESLPCFSRLAEKETQPASISLTVCTLAERKCDTGKLPGHRATLTKLAITVPGCRSRSGNLCPGDVPADLCRLYGVPRKMPMKTGEFKITSELNEREGAKSWIAATWSATWLQLHISPALLAKVLASSEYESPGWEPFTVTPTCQVAVRLQAGSLSFFLE